MIRVLHVITRLTLGGLAENTITQVETLGRAGYDCALAVGFGASEVATLEEARRRGCRLIDVAGLGREVAPGRDLAALGALWRLIARERPAIVHTHASKAGFLGRLAARLARVPAVVHQPHGHVFYGYWGRPRTALYIALERLAAYWADRIFTLTARGTEEHLARSIGRRAQYVAVPSGVPIEALRATAPRRGEARTRLGIEPAAFVILGVGRLVPIKGFDLLVGALPRVLASVPGARVLLVGEGPERAALGARAVAMGVADRVGFAGAVADPAAVATHLAAADVCAAPSRNEGMGRVLVEAMALGVPVIGAAVGGIPSVIGDDECGRLVRPDDEVALATALVDLGRDEALRRKLGEAGRARAAEFSTTVAEARLLAAYAALLREKGLA